MSIAQRIIATSGLPGAGKSTIAEGLSQKLQTPVFSVDPIEAAMWVSGLAPTETGIAAYRVAEALAAENLRLGHSVIIDAVNPVDAARAMWRNLSDTHRVPLTFIEVICSDATLHRQRIDARVRNIDGMPEVTWEQVLERKAEFEDWTDDRLLLDTATETPDVLIDRALSHIRT